MSAKLIPLVLCNGYDHAGQPCARSVQGNAGETITHTRRQVRDHGWSSVRGHRGVVDFCPDCTADGARRRPGQTPSIWSPPLPATRDTHTVPLTSVCARWNANPLVLAKLIQDGILTARLSTRYRHAPTLADVMLRESEVDRFTEIRERRDIRERFERTPPRHSSVDGPTALGMIMRKVNRR